MNRLAKLAVPILFATAVFAAAAARAADAPTPASLDPLSFLVGDWEATGQGKPGQGSGHSVFRQDLQQALKGDVLEGAFEIAPPGKPDAFQRYLSWQSHKAAKSQ